MAPRKKAPEPVVETKPEKKPSKKAVVLGGANPGDRFANPKTPDFKEFQGHPWVGHIVEASVKPCKKTGRKARKLKAKITGGYMGMVHFEGVGWYHESSLENVVITSM